MRKERKLSLFGILSLITVVLFLISISFTQANVKTKGNPNGGSEAEEATWAVRIPTSDLDFMFYGIGDGYYTNNDPNITVSVKKNTMAGPWRRYFNFVYAFDFTITNENVGTSTPPANQVDFQRVDGLYDIEYPDDDKPYNVFPGGDIVNFLNGTHPHAGGIEGEEDYQYFWCRVDVFDWDIELMSEGEIYLFGSGPDAGEPGDYLSMVARYRQECYPEPAYHDVELYRSINYWRAVDLGNPLNIEIERLDVAAYNNEFDIDCEAVWRIRVHPVDVSQTQMSGIPGFLKVKERYCNRKKWYYPMEAKGTFNFYIDFIKKQSSTQPEIPTAPSNLIATAVTCDQIDLEWTDNSDNEDGFEIERSLDGSNFSQIDTIEENATSYSDSGLDPETTYYYRVRAYNAGGDSDYSDAVSATTPSCLPGPPAAPTDLTAKARGRDKIALNWKDNSNNEDGFYIYQSSDGENFGLLDTVGQNTTSYVDTAGLASKTTYYYKVCAYNEWGESCSNITSATTK